MTALIIVLATQAYLLWCLYEMRHKGNLTLTIDADIYGNDKIELKGKEAIIETWYRFSGYSIFMWVIYYGILAIQTLKPGENFNKIRPVIALAIPCALFIFLNILYSRFQQRIRKSKLTQK